MKTLEKHEQFEMFILDHMHKTGLLNHIVFGGGTMLRLCYDLPRYSVDLDFYLNKDKRGFKTSAKRFSNLLSNLGVETIDEQEKYYTFLWEFRYSSYPRRLKVEIRKDVIDQAKEAELNVAHSPFLNLQVRLRTLTLNQMWLNKIRALNDRGEIRDAYDLEFITRRIVGDFNKLDKKTLNKLALSLNSFRLEDFTVKLGGVLDKEERKMVLSNRFAYLKSKIETARSFKSV